MNRLTFKEESGFYGVAALNNKDQQMRMCVKKLLDYEKTNFTPEDMVNLKDFMEEEKFLNLEDLKLFVKFSKNNSYNVIPILEYFREEMISKNTEISNLQKQLAELEIKNDKLGTDLYNAENICSYLQQQLAEKDRQLLELQEQSIRDNQIYNEELAEKEKEIEKYKELCTISKLEDLQIENMLLKSKVQDKIKFAKEQLEKLKNEFGEPSPELYTAYWINRKINQKIAELKGKEHA